MRGPAGRPGTRPGPVLGAHLSGFPSPGSDDDLRGGHVLPLREVVGLDAGRETVETSAEEDGFEPDLVTHDARMCFGLLPKQNGYVLEPQYRHWSSTPAQSTRNRSRSPGAA